MSSTASSHPRDPLPGMSLCKKQKWQKDKSDENDFHSWRTIPARVTSDEANNTFALRNNHFTVSATSPEHTHRACNSPPRCNAVDKADNRACERRSQRGIIFQIPLLSTRSTERATSPTMAGPPGSLTTCPRLLLQEHSFINSVPRHHGPRIPRTKH